MAARTTDHRVERNRGTADVAAAAGLFHVIYGVTQIPLVVVTTRRLREQMSRRPGRELTSWPMGMHRCIRRVSGAAVQGQLRSDTGEQETVQGQMLSVGRAGRAAVLSPSMGERSGLRLST
jgi:hypothetical protein